MQKVATSYWLRRLRRGAAVASAGARMFWTRRTRRALRLASAIVVVVVLALAMSAGGLFLLMRGEAIENTVLSQRIQARVQQLLGPEYRLDIGRTTVGFDRDGLLSFASSDVSIVRVTDRRTVSDLGKIIVGVRPFSLVLGNPQIDAVIVEDSSLNAAALSLPMGSDAAPRTVEQALLFVGERLRLLQEYFQGSYFRLFQFRRIHLHGVPVGAGKTRLVEVEELELKRSGRNKLKLAATLATEYSDIALEGNYQRPSGATPSLEVDLSGLSMREWLQAPSYRGSSGAGSDSLVAAHARIPLPDDGAGVNGGMSPEHPLITVELGPGSLRIGRKDETPLHELKLNLRLLPERNQIELDPSTLHAGGFQARLVGGILPVDPEAGFLGDIRVELIGDPMLGEPTAPGELSVPSAIKLGGRYQPDRRLLTLDDILVLAGKDRIIGSASFGFNGETPSVAAELRSDGIDVNGFRQLWPFWMGNPVRAWVHRHAIGGRLSNLRLSAAVPSGVIGRMRDGAKMQSEEFDFSFDFAGASLDTFGSLPPIEQAEGHFSLVGMRSQLDLRSGVSRDPEGHSVDVVDGRFVVEDFARRPNSAEVRLSVEGPARSLAFITDSAPLHAMAKMQLDPATVAGKADLDLVADFPIKAGLVPADVDWHAIVDLEDAGSSAPIMNRTVADADLVIEVTPQAARITGTALVDGTRTKLAMTEPLGDSKLDPVRNFSAELDDTARRKMGINLDQVINGPIQVSMEQLENDVQRQRIDMREAELTLPWIGWTKGKSIPADASFEMRQANGRTYLDNFYIEGEGFSAAGSMELDKEGLVAADFANISLNEGDSFSLVLTRKAGVFDIVVSGTRMDARGLVNKLFHQGGFGDEQGETDINLSAKLNVVRGFNGTVIRNVSLTYRTDDGWFDNLSLRGSFSQSAYVNIFATTQSGKTTFEIDSNSAGSALGFTDVYRRMSGGELHARLVRERGGPFKGPVHATNFLVIDEPRLERIISEPSNTSIERGQGAIAQQLRQVNTKRVRFIETRAEIEKGKGYFRVADGVLSGPQVGFTFDGLLYDENKNMDLTGTFLPAQVLSRAIGFIPLVGELLGNGRDSGLIGITFRMSGQSRNPRLEVNPMSVVAPGVFRKVFEYRN